MKLVCLLVAVIATLSIGAAAALAMRPTAASIEHAGAGATVSPSPSSSPGATHRTGGAGSFLAILVFIALAATAMHQFRRTRRAADPSWYDPTADPSNDPDLKR
ncbi:MAG: hypothetical protein QOC87_526 [Actinomycetota bacterium]|nr:hypothetical protein [Actinomycetota bacterium]